MAYDQEFSIVDTIISILLIKFLISFIGMSFWVVMSNGEEDNQEEFDKKFGMYYKRINHKRASFSKYYFTATFVRKFLFVFIPLIFYCD